MGQPSHCSGRSIRRLRVCLIAILVGLMTCAGCSEPSDQELGTVSDARSSPTPQVVPSPQRTSAPKPPESHSPTGRHNSRSGGNDPLVVIISVDGLNPDAVRPEAGRFGTVVSGFSTLMSEAAGTLNARSTFEQTNTLPNHASMLTGRSVGGAGGTRVVFNADNGLTLEETAGLYIPGVFDVAHDHGLATALFAEKDKFRFLVRSWDTAHGAVDRTGADNGTGKIDEALIAPAEQLLPAFMKRLQSGRGGLIFLHVAAPDLAGHTKGFMSQPYLDAVHEADKEVAAVLMAVRGSAGLRRRTTVIVTADHGGRGGGHSDATDPDAFRIPFYVWGRGVRPGDLYTLNPARADPGAGRPSYGGLQPVRNMDAAALALRRLGLPPLPKMFGSDLDALRTR